MPTVIEDLLAHPARFRFIEAVDAIVAANPDGVAPGGDGPPAREALRLRPQLSFGFPTADIAAAVEVAPTAEGALAHLRLETTFLGVYGQASPLPAFFTEELFADERGTVRDFIDIFHHRMLSLAWRAMTKYRLDRARDHDVRLRALAGFAPDVAVPEMPAGGDLLAVAGLLARQPRSGEALAAAIRHWLGVAVEIEQCSAVWVDLPDERRCLLGGANCALAGDMLAGSRIFSRTTAFTVIVGPVDSATFRRFLPGGDAMSAIAVLVGECNPERLDWSVEVVLAGDAVPPAALDGSARLGWDSRLDGPQPEDLRIRVNAT